MAFEKLKEKTSIEAVARHLGIELIASGKDPAQFRSPCPACAKGGKNALAINTLKQKFYCWTSNEHGDLIDLYMHLEKIDNANTAAKHLENMLAVPVAAKEAAPEPSSKLPAILASVLAYLVPDSDKLKVLGISADTCATFQAGYAPKDTMAGRFLIALHNPAAELVGFVGVALDGKEPRFLYPNNIVKDILVFNIHRVRLSETVTVASDPLAVLQAYEAGDPDSIAYL